jgi:hypothetical protein
MLCKSGCLHRFPSCRGKVLCKKGEEFQAKQGISSPFYQFRHVRFGQEIR